MNKNAALSNHNKIVTKNCFTIYNLFSDKAKQLILKTKNQGGATLFVGSGISLDSPTLLPSGENVTRYLAELLTEQFELTSRKEKTEVINAIIGTPFEYVWDQSPQNKQLEFVFINEYKNRQPNNIHYAIRDLVINGTIKHVITTNYDTCLDQVFQNIDFIKEVATENDSRNIESNQGIYFKIHGSAKSGLESTIVYRLSHEGILPSWKQKVLRRCLSNANLIVVGYSGLDFEICPEIKLAKPSQVIWNSFYNPKKYTETLKSNALRVLNSSDKNIVLWGDMKKLFSLLSGKKLPEVSRNKTIPNWRLDTLLSKTEIQLWACSVISPPGYGLQAQKLANKILSSIDETSPYWVTGIYLLGDAQFHQGKYVQSANNCSKAAQIYKQNKNLTGYIDAVSRQSDALRCAGNFWDALLVITEARATLSAIKLSKEDKRKFVGSLDLKELLVYRDFYEITKWLNNYKLAKSYQTYARRLISRITKAVEKEGQWHIFQQTKMWANRLEVDFNEIYKGTMQPLDDWFGFRHLGAIIPEMMATRDALWRGTTGRGTTINEVKKLVRRAKQIGCNPEIWKLSLIFNEKIAELNNKESLEWKKAFDECEYTDFLRKFKLSNPRHR